MDKEFIRLMKKVERMQEFLLRFGKDIESAIGSLDKLAASDEKLANDWKTLRPLAAEILRSYWQGLRDAVSDEEDPK